MPSKVYENEKVTELEKAMLDLLEQILFDPKMTVKEKKKKLRKFKELHPNIYSLRFPTQDSEPDYMQVWGHQRNFYYQLSFFIADGGLGLGVIDCIPLSHSCWA